MPGPAMTAGQPLVSIVTPVFNGEPFLRECIDSVLAQTYAHWDYTIVNNCSTDRTLEIAQEYAARDPRIRVITNDAFVRQIANFNIAFRQVSPDSKYCKPLAADDMLLPECLEKMVALAETHPRVGIVGAHGLYSVASMGVYCTGVPYPTEVLDGRDLCRLYLLGKSPSVFGPGTFILLRSDIVRSRQALYNESNIHADSEVFLDVLQQHDFGFVHQILTYMRIQDESLMALSARLNTHAPYFLHALLTYGPKYLTPEELQQRVDTFLDDYYKYLAWQVPKRRGKEFWDFHRRKLAELGHPLRTGRLAVATAAHLVEAALSPGRLKGALVRQIRGQGDTSR
jgi:glycosyltransferase involved in cell wall biosynthesis